jgi:hypothetical protein
MDLGVLFPETAPERKEVFDELITSLAEDTLRMVLNGLQGIFAVSDTHNDAGLLCHGCHGEIGG